MSHSEIVSYKNLWSPSYLMQMKTKWFLGDTCSSRTLVIGQQSKASVHILDDGKTSIRRLDGSLKHMPYLYALFSFTFVSFFRGFPTGANICILVSVFFEQIEDPFEQPQNTARAVNSRQLTRISEAFSNTYHRIIAPNQTRYTLIPFLVRREISHFFPGAAFMNPVHSRTYRNSHHPGDHASSKFQKTRQRRNLNDTDLQIAKQASQGQRPRNHPNKLAREVTRPSEGQKPKLPHTLQAAQPNNVTSQRPVNPSKGQPQQVWRPKQSDI